jgi:hypothetical protein
MENLKDYWKEILERPFTLFYEMERQINFLV